MNYSLNTSFFISQKQHLELTIDDLVTTITSYHETISSERKRKRDLENKICVLKGLRLTIDYSNDDFIPPANLNFFLNTFYDSDNNNTAECEVVCGAILLKDFERE